MKTIIKISSLLIFTSVIFMACQKETSFEQGNSTASVGSLSVDASNNCLGATPLGTYMKDTALKASNYVDVSVNVDTIGTYTISTDTVMGFYFKATGTFATTGTQNVRMIGGGKPSATGAYSFRVTYNNTFCDFTVTVTAPPPPTGGSSVFAFNCAVATPTGAYVVGTPLTAATNTVTLNVTVATAGTWSVNTGLPVNGITFSGSGTFSATGAQTITLLGSGTPTASGPNTYTVTGGGAATCAFQVTVAAALPSDYFPRTTNSNWSYQFNDVFNDSLLTKVIAPTHLASGKTFNIFMSTYGTTPGFDSALTDQYASYYRKSGSEYFEWIDMGSFVGLEAPFWMEYIFLKDNMPTGVWSSLPFTGPFDNNGTIVQVTLKWDFTVLSHDLPANVGGTSYQNVIKVRQELKLEVTPGTPGVWATQFYFENYYARNIGLIKQDFYNSGGTKIYAQDLRRHVIY